MVMSSRVGIAFRTPLKLFLVQLQPPRMPCGPRSQGVKDGEDLSALFFQLDDVVLSNHVRGMLTFFPLTRKWLWRTSCRASFRTGQSPAGTPRCRASAPGASGVGARDAFHAVGPSK